MRFIRPLAAALVLAALLLPVVATAQEPSVVSLQPVAFVPVEGETFTTDVTVENASDLLGFQFDVNFDPAAFAVDAIELGPFLSSTGRSAQPLGPDLRDAAEGRVVYGGFTLGAPEQAGAAGSGVLATVTWRVLQPADFAATLSRVQLAGPGGQAQPVATATSPATPQSALAGASDSEPGLETEPAPAVVDDRPASSSLPLPLLIGGAALLVVLVALFLFLRQRKKRESSA